MVVVVASERGLIIASDSFLYHYQINTLSTILIVVVLLIGILLLVLPSLRAH